MLKPSLQLRFGQSLSMTPQLQQAIKLLQLSSVELQQEIQQLFETNPMLEEDEGNDIQA
jgi:RNA polymerase sigma-54 factor